jgi:hypothetical protein
VKKVVSSALRVLVLAAFVAVQVLQVAGGPHSEQIVLLCQKLAQLDLVLILEMPHGLSQDQLRAIDSANQQPKSLAEMYLHYPMSYYSLISPINIVIIYHY